MFQYVQTLVHPLCSLTGSVTTVVILHSFTFRIWKFHGKVLRMFLTLLRGFFSIVLVTNGSKEPPVMLVGELFHVLIFLVFINHYFPFQCFCVVVVVTQVQT